MNTAENVQRQRRKFEKEILTRLLEPVCKCFNKAAKILILF
jgi:hypothetical protein